MTRLARDVAPDNAWADYLRLQIVSDECRSLNGLGDYPIKSRESAWKKPNVGLLESVD